MTYIPIYTYLLHLQEINHYLGAYKYLNDSMDAWVILHVDDLSIVFDWREAAEEAARLAGKSALTTEQVRDFVMRFFPAYRNYLPKLIDLENNGLGSKPTIKVS
jgi:pantothenate kinase-related protein Tda10